MPRRPRKHSPLIPLPRPLHLPKSIITKQPLLKDRIRPPIRISLKGFLSRELPVPLPLTLPVGHVEYVPQRCAARDDARGAGLAQGFVDGYYVGELGGVLDVGE